MMASTIGFMLGTEWLLLERFEKAYERDYCILRAGLNAL